MSKYEPRITKTADNEFYALSKDVMKFTCCDRQALFVMDYKWPCFAPPEEQVIKINTMCTRCQKHWFGTEDDIKEFTGKEWEKYINGSLKD